MLLKQVENTVGNGENSLLRAISPFPSVFKRLVLQTCKNQDLFGKGLTLSHKMKNFDAPYEKPFENIVGFRFWDQNFTKVLNIFLILQKSFDFHS